MPKGPKGEKRHADTVQNAMLTGRIATGEVEDKPSMAPNRARGGIAAVRRELRDCRQRTFSDCQEGSKIRMGTEISD